MMLPLKRFLIGCMFGALLFSLLNAANNPKVQAQGTEPAALIDSIFNDLSQKLGRTITRRNADNWDWTEDVYPDTSIGCPKPGQTYTKGSIRGYKITITVNGVVYDYRAVKGSNAFFRCSPADTTIAPTAILAATTVPNVQATLPPTVAPIGVATIEPVTALPATQNLLAFIAADGNVHVLNLTTNSDTVITQDAEVKNTIERFQPDAPEIRRYANLRWSPDGTKLLYSEVKSGTIYVVTPGQQPIQIATDLASGKPYLMPGAWSPDGSEIAYDKGSNVFIVPSTGGISREFFTSNSGCGGSGDQALDPAYLLYRQDNNLNSIRPRASQLFWTLSGILYTPDSCTPWIMLSPTGQTLWKLDINHGKLSPDQKQLASFTVSKGKAILQLTNLATGQTVPTTFDLPANVEALGWTADGSALLYELSMPGEFVKSNADSTTGGQLFPEWWSRMVVGTNSSSLWRLPLNSGRPTQLFARQGFGIGSISTAPDNSGVAFTWITSAAPMLKLINAGKSASEINAALPHAELYFIQYDTLTYRRLALGGQPAFSRVVQPVAPTTPQAINCPGAPLSRLVVGGQGRVLPGDPNDIRPAPGAASIGQIPAGATFMVLEGPTCTPNGIAWWRVSYNGQTGWTAEGQGSTYFVEPA